MQNKQDENGWPICPVCSTSIRAGQGAIRPDGYMVHKSPCWESGVYNTHRREGS